MCKIVLPLLSKANLTTAEKTLFWLAAALCFSFIGDSDSVFTNFYYLSVMQQTQNLQGHGIILLYFCSK